MFKLLLKIILSILFCLCFLIDGGSFLKVDGLHTFYLYSKSSNAKIVTLTEDKAYYFTYFKNSIKGESVIFYNEEKVIKLISDLSAKKMFCENGENFHCEYYYTDKIDDYVILNGEKINLHVCYLEDYISVGTPIVFGSY